MSETTYDVRIWKTEVYKGKRATTHYVRWVVAGRSLREPFTSAPLADGFRSDLVAAARKGEAFHIESGLPVSMVRQQNASMTWYAFACSFADMKWKRAAATTRRTHAEALSAITLAMFTSERGMPDAKLVRHALNRWAFNPTKRNADNCPPEVKAALRWIETHTRQVSALAKPVVLRAVLDSLTVCLDGTTRASSVVSRWRKIFNTSLEYAVEGKHLQINPMPALKWTVPKTTHLVDRRAVANPIQARTLLNALEDMGRSGPRLVGYFACLYFAGLRPEEATSLAKRNLSLPDKGWGELHLEVAEPHAGREWTDSGKNRDRRQLKQRAVGEGRTVPSCPELTAHLHRHMKEFGTSPDGRLFRGERNAEELPKGTVNRYWRLARAGAFTPEVYATPLAATPYDLRHAAVSTWLNGGVPSTTVAEWAGHSVEILLKIYAKCLDGGEQQMFRQIQRALGHDEG
ncbi:integrase [Allocatelliglobosispora scoriae]|uniref:Integrase n=1 Tax=Allocatelliglobosispora scoriae TaxID=643052 RepID=A0A841BUV7_9ACTN|nr:tyrosine-type recombinase/integrase [Allocatelliglobosispora scoriae]MBB5871984.1 integrase [Allocatelliglobosispora scoriae]